MDIRKCKDVIPQASDSCHGGKGTLMCRSLLDGLGSERFNLMHSDDMPAGVSIGLHTHTGNEEI